MKNIHINYQQNSAIFIHIPKAGGTTLTTILRKNYDLDNIFAYNGRNDK